MLAGTSLNDGPFVTVDIETTGCRPGTNDIIEIGAAYVRDGIIVARFGELVRPSETIPPAIRHLTGIDDEMVADADDVHSVMQRLREFVGDSVLIAHNHRFDLGFLDYEAERTWGTPFPRPVLDTLVLARRLHPELERHNLRALAQAYQVETVPDHRASTDALATAEVWCRMTKELLAKDISTAGDVANYCGLARQGALARKLVLATHLPDAPGVYIMRDSEGGVVRVGRAKSLRTRVRSYFYAPVEHTAKHPAVLTSSVEYVECASPLDAHLLESRLSLRYSPLLDKDHERGRNAVYVHIDTDSPFPRLRVTDRRYAGGLSIGPLTNRWAADTLVDAMSRHYGLRRCTRRLDRNTASRFCQHRADGTCPRPCEGRITQSEYRKRVDAALGVFDSGADRFRTALQSLRETAASEQRYEDAISFRDALRALDRTMSALQIVRDAAATPGVVIIEGNDRSLALHLVRHGYLVKTLRYSKVQVSDASWDDSLMRALRRAYGHMTQDAAHARLTQRQLRDIFLIHTYRQQNTPSEIRFGSDVDDLAHRVAATSRRFMRVPSNRHGAASAD